MWKYESLDSIVWNKCHEMQRRLGRGVDDCPWIIELRLLSNMAYVCSDDTEFFPIYEPEYRPIGGDTDEFGSAVREITF